MSSQRIGESTPAFGYPQFDLAFGYVVPTADALGRLVEALRSTTSC